MNEIVREMTREELVDVNNKLRSEIEELKADKVERKRGRWLNINESEKWECSECGRMMWFSPRLGVKPSDYNFCPNCGADMREGEEE